MNQEKLAQRRHAKLIAKINGCVVVLGAGVLLASFVMKEHPAATWSEWLIALAIRVAAIIAGLLMIRWGFQP